VRPWASIIAAVMAGHGSFTGRRRLAYRSYSK
jgi:hypothetical protein